MARFNRPNVGNSSVGVDRGVNSNIAYHSVMPDGQSYDAPDDSADYSGSVSDRVKNSQAYKDAFALFSQEPNQTWLHRLMAIPTSVGDAKETWLDQLGATNNYHDKQNANYQYCIEQINALVAEYQSWKNSLPKTQVQQMADAGINSAITGQGITGSDIPNVGVSSDPSTLQSTNPADFILSASSFLLDSVTGLTSVVKGFRELGIAERNEMLDFKKYLRENGISLHTDKKYDSLRSLFKGIHNGEPYAFQDSKGETIRLENVVEKMLTSDAYAPFIKRWSDRSMEHEGYDRYEWSGVFSNDFSGIDMVGVDAVTDAEYENFLIDTKRAYLQNQLSVTAARNDISMQESEKISKDLNNKMFELQVEQMKVKLNLIKKLKDSNSLADKLLLQKVLLGYNATEQSILGTNLEFLQSEKALGLFGQILGIFK